MADVGRVTQEKGRGWHILFRSVYWPGAEKATRVRITRTAGGAKIRSKSVAKHTLTEIRDRGRKTPLHEVLRDYMPACRPEDTVPHRWRTQFVPAKRIDLEHGDIGPDRFRALDAFPGRGYLAFWDSTSIDDIDEPAVHRWYDWLRQTFPHLQPPTLRHILYDFRTFARYLKRVGAIKEVPTFPTVRIARPARRVPDSASLWRILQAIPEPERGLWLARGLAGLRPAEARRLVVANYREGAITIPETASKTKVARVLLIAHVAPELDAWIRRHRVGARPFEPLFSNPRARDGRWRRTPERRVWIAALAEAGVEYVKPNHGGRHAFATAEILDGTAAYDLREWLGHSSINTTQQYVDSNAVGLALRMRRPKSVPSSKGGTNS